MDLMRRMIGVLVMLGLMAAANTGERVRPLDLTGAAPARSHRLLTVLELLPAPDGTTLRKLRMITC